MRIFEHPNTSNNWKCPICNTNEDKQVILIGIEGTEEDGNIQAEQFHLDCIESSYRKYFTEDKDLIYQLL